MSDEIKLSHIQGDKYKAWSEALKSGKPVDVPKNTIACGYYRSQNNSSVTFHPNNIGGFYARETSVDGKEHIIASPEYALDVFNDVSKNPVSYEDTLVFLNTQHWPDEDRKEGSE